MTKKIISIILIIIIFSSNITLARIEETGIKLHSKNNYTGLIKYDGKDLELEHVVYTYKNKEYPAYKQDYATSGITAVNTYTVDVQYEIYNMDVWQIITKGYPYKTYSQIGCTNNIEAYLATQLAIYNYYNNYDINKFETTDEFGENVIKGMQNITNTINNIDARKYPTIQVVSKSNYEWQLDSQTDYLYKTYKIECAELTDIKTEVLLEGEVPEGMIVTDINNKEKTEFEYSDEIKISVPRLNLVRSGNFNIKFVSNCKTKPIYYASTNIMNYAGYLLTDDGLEEIITTQKENYTKHAAQVHIEVVDGQTRKPLPNVEFELLDINKQYLKTYKTDETGSVIIRTDVGDYYLKQTKVDDEYTVYEDLILLEMRLNKQLGVTMVLNKKEEITIETEDIEIKDDENSGNKHQDNNMECPPEEVKGDTKYEQSTDMTVDGNQHDNNQNEDRPAIGEIQTEENKNEQVNEQIKQDDTQTEETEEKEEISEKIPTTSNIKKLPRTGM